jgi:hypothetical protein
MMKFKKLLLLFTLITSSFAYAENAYWYDIMFEVDIEKTENFTSLVNHYYSSIEIPENVDANFSDIIFKGLNEKGTHILSFSSGSSKSLAEFINAMSGKDWDLYSLKMHKNIKSSRSFTGNRTQIFNTGGALHPIGQAWAYNVKDFDSFSNAFKKLMRTYQPDGYIAMGELVHGTDNGENVWIYTTYADLSEALTFGAKNDSEKKAFSIFHQEISNETFSATYTRKLIKSF